MHALGDTRARPSRRLRCHRTDVTFTSTWHGDARTNARQRVGVEAHWRAPLSTHARDKPLFSWSRGEGERISPPRPLPATSSPTADFLFPLPNTWGNSTQRTRLPSLAYIAKRLLRMFTARTLFFNVIYFFVSFFRTELQTSAVCCPFTFFSFCTNVGGCYKKETMEISDVSTQRSRKPRRNQQKNKKKEHNK